MVEAELGIMGPEANECRQTVEAGGGKEQMISWSFQKEQALPAPWFLAPWDSSQMSGPPER